VVTQLGVDEPAVARMIFEKVRMRMKLRSLNQKRVEIIRGRLCGIAPCLL
jgi:hypothetical protein